MSEIDKLKNHLRNQQSKGNSSVTLDIDWLLKALDNYTPPSTPAQSIKKVTVDGGGFN